MVYRSVLIILDRMLSETPVGTKQPRGESNYEIMGEIINLISVSLRSLSDGGALRLKNERERDNTLKEQCLIWLACICLYFIIISLYLVTLLFVFYM